MTPRARSIVSVSMLALAWVWTATAFADAATAPAAGGDVLNTMLSGSGNAALLAIFLWTKLTAQDKEIAEMKALLKSRPCVVNDSGTCDVHNGNHKRGRS